MDELAASHRFLEGEARALLTRLRHLSSFALRETMVPAAALTFDAQAAIERHVARLRDQLRRQVQIYLRWLNSPAARQHSPAEAQRRFTMLRLRFVLVLSQFDIFSEVMTQRSENETGVWLSGLDVLATDALTLPGAYFEPTPVVCYLARGHGAAIRRVKTRLPGGEQNPVAIIRIPRERMVGSGIGSSLVHEVGHQGAANLDLVTSLRLDLKGRQTGSDDNRLLWTLFEGWISEIVADLWSVARLGVAATAGLIGVVSLPRFFVFRMNLDDPHPPPWIRVKLSCAMGDALYPDPQWKVLSRLWDSFYPLAGLDPDRGRQFALLNDGLPVFVEALLAHSSASLKGRPLGEVMRQPEIHSHVLRAHYASRSAEPRQLEKDAPTFITAAIGQARADGSITPEAESRLLGRLLTHWALESTISRSAICARPPAIPATMAAA